MTHQRVTRENPTGNGAYLSPLEREKARSDELLAKALAYAWDIEEFERQLDRVPSPSPSNGSE